MASLKILILKEDIRGLQEFLKDLDIK